MTTDTTTRPLTELNPEELHQERQRLAYEASIGTPGAAKQLEAVEKQLGVLDRDTERAGLAVKEASRRAALQAEEQAAARRAELETQLAAELTKRAPLVARAEAAMTSLLEALAELDAVSKMAYGITSELGVPKHKLIIGERVSAWVGHRVSAIIGGPRAPRELRGSLAELLGVEIPKSVAGWRSP